MMTFMEKKVLKCLQERKFVDIGLVRPDTLPQVIVEFMKVVNLGLEISATLTQLIAEVVDVGQVLPATITLVTTEDILIDVDLGHKRPDTLPLEIG